MNARFSGKLALVTGGTGALGRAVSVGFLKEGAKVVVTYRGQEEFDDLKRIAGSDALSLQGQRVDVTDEIATNRLVQGVVAEHGRLDVVVNTVGAYAGGVKLWEMDSRVFDQMLAANLRSGYVVSRAVVPVMLAQKYGVIINIASKAAFDHAAGNAAYAASKAAAVAMMDSLAEDLRGTGVRVNSILPSIIDTEANRKAMRNADYARWPKPEDIARVILFLASDDAKVIHGAAVPVYGNS
ncbi:MAG TPA: SDR family NAD(P)-dependent oxidoreductase [Terriglobales bacterium]|nr:SDR family NAD(P)-dependent oxidoreductase [Terriglobales bacterium]